MNDIILQILNIMLLTTFLSFSMIKISSILTKEAPSKKQILLSILTILMANVIAAIIQTKLPVLNTITFVVLLFLMESFILKVSKLKSILLVIVVIILTFLTELISYYIISSIFKVSTEEIYENKKLLLLMYLVINALNYTIAFIYIKLNKKHTNITNITASNAQLINVLLLLLISTLPQIILFILTDYSYSKFILITNSIQMIFFCIILFRYFRTTLQKEKTESDLAISEMHNKTMVSMVDGVRTLKHDYNNIMQALNGYVSTKQYDKLQEHINKVLEECNIVNNLSLIDPKIFNDPAIYGIVGAKYFMAVEKDIKFEFDIVTNIKEINFSMPELSRILGILLDNAIEATLKSENKYIKLEMKYDNRKCADVIKIYNTYDTSIEIDLKDIYEKGVSSKEVKSGIGLWEVKKLVKKSKNSQIYASIEHNVFVQNLIIEKPI